MDKRSLRSRLRLHRALRDLMVDTPPDSISVEALARHAGVTRQTFYAHYSGIPQLIEEHLDTMLDEIAARHRATFRDADAAVDPDRLRQLMASVFADLDPDDPRLIALLNGAVGTEPETRFGALLERFLAEGDPEGSAALAPGAQAMHARFFAAGFVGVLRHWVALGPGRPDPELMAERLADLCLYGRKGLCPFT
ncbi:DNA-binding transcriptional regulator, AcrR family [Roseivivax sediminis]|uniref:DNA-binding transcriptional regulator, AcrR family n=2 Tax=Roseivivax sediminis TaxID=936889 RepID=A0A1I2BY53_9RHOB|nr:DNA-binding transcriptional regulator, AcrR family [Roseivivax sediminis]